MAKHFIFSIILGACVFLSATATLKPQHLEQGDTVALVAPAFQFDPDRLIFSVERMKAFGLNPIYENSILGQYGYFADSADKRAKAINDAIYDPKVKAIFALRGGYGSADVLDKIDYQALKQHPKIVMGYSDITALLTAIYVKTGLITFHGPLAGLKWTPFTAVEAKKLLFSDSKNVVLRNEEKEIEDKDIIQSQDRAFTITPGVVEGIIIGGNLSVFDSLIGTPYFPEDWNGKILFLEDVGEDIYSIDRLLGHLKNIGVLSKISGFVFGTCSECETKEHGGFYLKEVLDHYIKPLGIPAYRGAMIGHQDDIFTVPVGLPVKLDATNKTIELLESATL